MRASAREPSRGQGCDIRARNGRQLSFVDRERYLFRVSQTSMRHVIALGTARGAAGLMEPCKVCNGTGKVPRPRRRLPNGEPDRLDTIDWPEVICGTCHGSGETAVELASIQETAPGN